MLENGWGNIDQTQVLLSKLGYQKQPGFLLLNKEEEEQNLAALNDRAIPHFFDIAKKWIRVRQNGISNFFPYSIIKESGVTETRSE